MARLLKNRRLLGGAGCAAILLAMALWPRSVAVDVATVERGPLQVTVDEEGETRVHDRFVISAPVAGRLLRIELEPGDRVERGRTLLATLRPSDPVLLDARSRAEAQEAVRAADAALGRARAERERAAAALALASAELARARSLASEQLVSRQELEDRESAARSAAEAHRGASFAAVSAEHELAMARARLGRFDSRSAGVAIEIRSPIDGVVLKRHRESESTVPAGEPLLDLGDPAQLEIVSDLLSTDAVKVRPGNPVLVERWGGERDLRGRVRRVEPSGFLKISALGVEEQRVNVVVDFEDPAEAWKALGDSYRVELRIVVWQAENVLKVPTSALFRRGDGWAVFAAVRGAARLRPAEIGRRNGLEAEVLSGLDAGERVVVHPSDSLHDGSRLSFRAS
jgi:HlyD family secretion protein